MSIHLVRSRNGRSREVELAVESACSFLRLDMIEEPDDDSIHVVYLNSKNDFEYRAAIGVWFASQRPKNVPWNKLWGDCQLDDPRHLIVQLRFAVEKQKMGGLECRRMVFKSQLDRPWAMGCSVKGARFCESPEFATAICVDPALDSMENLSAVGVSNGRPVIAVYGNVSDASVERAAHFADRICWRETVSAEHLSWWFEETIKTPPMIGLMQNVWEKGADLGLGWPDHRRNSDRRSFIFNWIREAPKDDVMRLLKSLNADESSIKHFHGRGIRTIITEKHLCMVYDKSTGHKPPQF